MTQLTDWINKTERKEDNISIVLARRMAAIMGGPTIKVGDPLPHLWHWMFFQPELTADQLGRDGHPALGGFMPPANGRNRMWAGGSFKFHKPLIIGEDATCSTLIKNIVEKEGSTGSLVFVTLEHTYFQRDELCVTEEQTIVYREPSPPKESSKPAPESLWSRDITPDATLLFRYSAVTYNGHRIHYDYPYVTETEGYRNLVVHGPMMATWVLHEALKANPDKTVDTFEFRGVRPTLLPDKISVAGRLGEDGNAEVWIANENGLIQTGRVTFHS